MRKGLAHRLRRIEKGAAPLDPRRVHRPRHDVPRRQIGVRMIAQQEGAAAIDQPRPLAAQGLGRQRRRVQSHIDGRRMELHELGVQHLGPGLPGQRQPLAAQGRWIGRRLEQAADPPGGQHHGGGEHFVQAAASAFDHRAAHPTVHVADQAAQPAVFPDLNGLRGPRGGDHGRQYGPARAVAAHPRHARQTVRRLQTDGKAAVVIAVEGRAQPGQPLDRLTPPRRQGARRLGLDQTGARAFGILGVQGRAVLR